MLFLFKILAGLFHLIFPRHSLQTSGLAFALSKSLGILSSLFSPLPAWQTSRLAFAFSRAYIFHVCISFFTSNLDYSTQLQLFQQQISFLVIKIKQVPFLLFSCSLLFNRVVIVCVSFSALSLVNIRIPLLIFPKPLAYCRVYFLRTQLGKHRNLLLIFCRLIFSTSALDFSHRTLNHSTQLLLFLQQIYFPLFAFAEGYNHEFQTLLSLLCFSLFKSCGSHRCFLSRHSTSDTSEFCFCSFKIPWHTVELIISTSNLANIETRFFFFAFS